MGQIVSDFKPDMLIFLGDYLDFINLSMHGPKDPRVFQNLVDEVESGVKGLDEVDKAFPDIKKVFIEGNHCFRLERYILHAAPALFGMTSVRNLLQMDQRTNWHWVEYGPNQRFHIGGDVYARHEPLKNQPHLTIREGGVSLYYGHVHKREFASKTMLDDRKLFAGCPGWVGNPNAPAFKYVKGIQNWQWGFSALWLDGTNAHPVFPSISDNGVAVFEGRVYRG